MNFLGFTFTSGSDLSFLLLLAGFLLYYFGRTIADENFRISDAVDIYVQGFYFVAFYVLFPLLIIYTVLTRKFNMDWSLIVWLLLQFALLWFLNLKKKGIDVMHWGLEGIVNKKVQEVAQNAVNRTKFKKWIKRNNVDFGVRLQARLLYSRPATFTLFVCSFLTILSNYFVFVSTASPIFKFISLFFSVVILTLVASLSVFNLMPEVTVYLEKDILKGRLSKIESGYITIVSDNYAYNVNKDKVLLLERKMFDKSKLFKNLKLK